MSKVNRMIKIVLLIMFWAQNVKGQEDISQTLFIEGPLFHKKIQIKHNNEKIYNKRITHCKNEAVRLADVIDLGTIEGEIVVKVGVYNKIQITLDNLNPYIYLTKKNCFSTVFVEQKSKRKYYR